MKNNFKLILILISILITNCDENNSNNNDTDSKEIIEMFSILNLKEENVNKHFEEWIDYLIHLSKTNNSSYNFCQLMLNKNTEIQDFTDKKDNDFLIEFQNLFRNYYSKNSNEFNEINSKIEELNKNCIENNKELKVKFEELELKGRELSERIKQLFLAKKFNSITALVDKNPQESNKNQEEFKDQSSSNGTAESDHTSESSFKKSNKVSSNFSIEWNARKINEIFSKFNLKETDANKHFHEWVEYLSNLSKLTYSDLNFCQSIFNKSIEINNINLVNDENFIIEFQDIFKNYVSKNHSYLNFITSKVDDLFQICLQKHPELQDTYNQILKLNQESGKRIYKIMSERKK